MRRNELPELVTLLSPSGFCAGVEASIKALAWMIAAFPGRRVFCYHEIVHNGRVVDVFRDAGVTFVNGLEDVPDDAPLMLSAHGSSPQIVAEARRKTRHLVDSVCPLVRKVHNEARRQADAGHRIIYFGHAGHDEAVGTLAIAPDAITLVEDLEDVAKLTPDARPVSILTQTTLSDERYRQLANAVEDRLGPAWEAPRPDRCFATTNRQSAVRHFAAMCDALVVVGAPNSSNTRALEEVAREAGCREVQRVNDCDEIRLPLGRHVALTAGASAPDQIVEEVIEYLIDGDWAKLRRVSLDVDEPTFRAPTDLVRLARERQSIYSDCPSLNRVNDPKVRASKMLGELTA